MYKRQVFIGSAIALRKNSHLQVDVFLNLMKERTKYIYTIVVTILGILFLAVLFVYSISLCKISAVNITPVSYTHLMAINAPNTLQKDVFI